MYIWVFVTATIFYSFSDNLVKTVIGEGVTTVLFLRYAFGTLFLTAFFRSSKINIRKAFCNWKIHLTRAALFVPGPICLMLALEVEKPTMLAVIGLSKPAVVAIISWVMLQAVISLRSVLLSVFLGVCFFVLSFGLGEINPLNVLLIITGTVFITASNLCLKLVPASEPVGNYIFSYHLLSALFYSLLWGFEGSYEISWYALFSMAAISCVTLTANSLLMVAYRHCPSDVLVGLEGLRLPVTLALEAAMLGTRLNPEALTMLAITLIGYLLWTVGPRFVRLLKEFGANRPKLEAKK